MRRIILLWAGFLGVSSAVGQIATRVDQYYQDFSILNPATINAAGSSALNVFYNHLYTGVKSSPTNLLISAIFPNPEKHVGFGGNFSQEKIGFSTLYNGYLSYVYSFNTGKKSRFHTAASVGMVSQRFNPNAIDVISQDDPYYLSLQQGRPSTKFDLKASFCYQVSGFMFGVSSGRLTKPRFTYDYYNYSATYSLSNLTNVFLSARFKMAGDVIMQPLVSANVYDLKNVMFNYGVNFSASDIIWVGIHNAGYKNISLHVGGQVRKSVRIGYSYSMPYSNASKLLGSGHEFFTSISLGKTSELVKDLNFDAITVNRTDVDTSSGQEGNTNNTGNPTVKQPEKVAPNGNVVEIQTLNLKHDTIVIGSFEDMKFLKSGYDTSKILLKDLKQVAPPDGYYVTIGTFKYEANANRYIKMMYAKGYTSYKFFYPESKYYYVYIMQSESNEEAEQIKWQEQLEFPDIWVRRVFKKLK